MRYARFLFIVLVGFSLACAEAPAPAEYPDAVTADPDHYSVEFENDAVRLLRVSYGPGEESVMHAHPVHCAVSLGDGTWMMALPDDEAMDLSMSDGELVCIDPGVHLPTNSGESTAAAILVEFKEGAAAGTATSEYPDAVTADPDHYTVEWENDVARLLRIQYAAGETSVMHHHPANCAIFLGSQLTTFELPDGTVEEPPATELGQVLCSDAHDHLPTNVGDGPLELVLLELKGRAAFGE